MSVVTFCIWVWRDIVTLLVLLYAVVTWLSISVTVLRKLTPSLKKKKKTWAVCWVFVAWNKFINICKWLQDFIIVLWMTCVEVMWNFYPSFEHRGAQRTNDGLSLHQYMSVIVVFMINVITPIITSINLVTNINIIVIIVIPVIIIINAQGGVNISCFMISFYAPKTPAFLYKLL